jgi:hypothetical protein
MKVLIIFLIIKTVLIFSAQSFSLETNPICLNSSLQTTIDFDESNKSINLQINEAVANVEVTNIYVVDGVEIYSNEISEVSKNREYNINLDYEKSVGQGLIIINVEFSPLLDLEGVVKREVISVPIGELSEQQILNRRKRIKIYRAGPSEIGGNGKISPSNLKVHELPLVKR